MRLDRLKVRCVLVLSTFLYVLVFNLTYHGLVAPNYGIWGLSARPTELRYLVLSWVLSLVPSLWLPTGMKRPSQLFFLIQYYMVFIPSCFVLYNMTRPELDSPDVCFLILLMFAGLSLIQFIYYLPLFKARYLTVHPTVFWVGFYAMMAALLAYMLVAFSGNFRLANLEEIYSVRAAMAEAVEGKGSRFGFYAQMWLAGFFLPFCAAMGMMFQRKRLLIMVTLGYLILFGIGGSKTTLFSFVYFPAIMAWIKYSKRHAISCFALGLSTLLLGGFLFAALGMETVGTWYVAIVNVRIFSIPAQLIGQFYDFFSHNPLTYLSHVNGVNLLIPYPYQLDIPTLLGLYYFGVPVGSNAGVWAGDGLTAFGAPGIIIMSLVCAVLFWVFDSIARRWDTSFVIIAVTFIGTSFGNISLFTLISSGGLGFLLLAFLIAPASGTLRPALRPLPGGS